MYTEFLSTGDYMVLPLFGLGIFLSVFAGVIVYVALRMRRGPALDRVAHLPLESDENVVPATKSKKGGTK